MSVNMRGNLERGLVVELLFNRFAPLAALNRKIGISDTAEEEIEAVRAFIKEQLPEIGEGKHLYYPSLRLTIQCFHDQPLDRPSIDARKI